MCIAWILILGSGFRRGGKPVQKRRINGTAIELSKAKITIEANTGLQGITNCGIDRLRQCCLLHDQLPTAGGGEGLVQSAILPWILFPTLIQLQNDGCRPAKSENLVENAICEEAL